MNVKDLIVMSVTVMLCFMWMFVDTNYSRGKELAALEKEFHEYVDLNNATSNLNRKVLQCLIDSGLSYQVERDRQATLYKCLKKEGK